MTELKVTLAILLAVVLGNMVYALLDRWLQLARQKDKPIHEHIGECIEVQHVEQAAMEGPLGAMHGPAGTYTLGLMRCTCGQRWVCTLRGRWSKDLVNGVSDKDIAAALLDDMTKSQSELG